MSTEKNESGGLDPVFKRDVVMKMRTGDQESSLEFWHRLRKLCDKTIHVLLLAQKGDT